jgi:hypothetical protein
VNWDLIPTSAIAGIQLIPGSNPVFGLNTLGGALAVTTKSGTQNPGASVEASAGSFGRRTLTFEAGGARDQFDAFLPAIWSTMTGGATIRRRASGSSLRSSGGTTRNRTRAPA